MSAATAVLLLVLAGLTIASLAVSAEPPRAARHAAPRPADVRHGLARPPVLQLHTAAAGPRGGGPRHRAAAAAPPPALAAMTGGWPGTDSVLGLSWSGWSGTATVPMPRVASRAHA